MYMWYLTFSPFSFLLLLPTLLVHPTILSPPSLAETVVFLYIGMQVFTISTSFRVELIIWSLVSEQCVIQV